MGCGAPTAAPYDPPAFEPTNPVLRWLEARLPILGFGYSAGGILSDAAQFELLVDVRRHPHLHADGADRDRHLPGDALHAQTSDMAFNSVEHIMRDVNYGWLLRYLHSNGASMFFLVVYIHIFRGMYYGSYKSPREVLWMLGVIIYLLMMATGFMGYVLPWGQMSYWAATVITNLFSAIPVVGDPIVTWLWGGFSVGNPTLNRFFSLHYLLPFVILGVVVLHIWALHVVGQNNPAGIDPKDQKDTVPFTPYSTIKDVVRHRGVLRSLYAWFVFYMPNYLGHADNYIPANPVVTPSHIVPEWYYLPFYAILRSIPNKLVGVMALFGSIAILVLPALARHVEGHARRPIGRCYRQFFWMFVAVPASASAGSARSRRKAATCWRRGVLTAWYFLHFLVVLPLLGLFERPKPLPNSISEAVLKKQEGRLRRFAAVLAVGTGALRRLAAPFGLRAGARSSRAAPQFLVVRRGVRPITIPASCSAASRSITRSARPVTA